MNWATFDEMVWPIPDKNAGDLEWHLRYATEWTLSDRLAAASIVSAYRALVPSPRRKRDYVIAKLREALTPTAGTEE
jgi:hypothetical protein